MATTNARLACTLNIEVLSDLSLKLNPRLIKKDFRALAGKMGYTLERVINFELEANPTLAVLRDWWTSSSIEPKTVPALVKYLKEIGREDAATLLRPYEYQDTIDPLYDPYNPFPVTGQHFAGAYNIPSNLRQHPQENYESSSDSMNDYKQQACAVVDLPPFRDRIQNNGLYSPESHEYLNQPQQGNLQRLNIPQSLDNLSQLNNINGYNNMYNSHQMNNLENSHRMNSVPRHAVIQTSLPVIADKVALVLGNQAYHHPKLQGLCYSENDAYDVAEALKNMQFKVVSLINLTLEELRTAMLAFCRLLGPGVYGVVYYAGHAYEDNGEQFILPIDANLQYRREESLRAQEILEAMQQCDTLLNLFILDACRVRLPKKGPEIPVIRKLARGNNIFAYSCSQGQESFEAPNQRNGVYASYLLRHLEEERRIEHILMDVAQEVASFHQLDMRPCLESDSKCNCCLKFPIQTGGLSFQQQERSLLWKQAHVVPDSFVAFQNNDIFVQFVNEEMFSNAMIVTIQVRNITPYLLTPFVVTCKIQPPLSLKNISCSDVCLPPQDNMFEQKMLIFDIQKLSSKINEEAIISMNIMYKIPEVSSELESYNKNINFGHPLVASITCHWDEWITGGRTTWQGYKCTTV